MVGKQPAKVEARSFARLLGDPHGSAQTALLRSQVSQGPLASAPFVSMPIDKVAHIDSQSFRLLFLRRLRQPRPHCLLLPMWLSPQKKTALAIVGLRVQLLVGRRGFPLENMAARIC